MIVLYGCRGSNLHDTICREVMTHVSLALNALFRDFVVWAT